MTAPVTVVLTGIGGGGHGEQILKALRLGQLKYRIIGTDMSADCANRGEVDEFVVVPSARDPRYIALVSELARSRGAVAILHGSEPEMAALSQARGELEAEGFYVPVNSPDVMRICLDKSRTIAHLKAAGFRVPAYREVGEIGDVAGYDAFPAVLKPAIGGGGSANVFIVQSSDELEFFATYLLRIGNKIVLQEYVGTPEKEYTVGVLFGRDGKLLNSIAIRRIINNALTIRTRVPNRTGRSDLGANLVISTGISQGVIGDWPEIRRRCEEIAASLNPTAPVNIQCRTVDGEVVPFEINPRFSGTTSLRAMAGYNEPDILIRRDVFGEEIEPHFGYREVTILRGLREFALGVEDGRAVERKP